MPKEGAADNRGGFDYLATPTPRRRKKKIKKNFPATGVSNRRPSPVVVEREKVELFFLKKTGEERRVDKAA